MSGFRLLSKSMGLRNRRLLRVLFSVVLLLYTMKMGLLLSLPLFATQEYGFDATQRSLLSTVYGAVQILGQLCIPLLLAKLSQRQAVGAGVLAGFVACSIPAIPGMPGGWLFVSQSFLAVCFVAFTVCCTLATRMVPAEFAGEAAALINAATSLTSGLGPLVFSLLATAFLKTAYPGGAFLIFSVIILLDILLCFQLPVDEAVGTNNSGPDDECCMENVQDDV